MKATVEVAGENAVRRDRPYVAVEGNIAAGKSELCRAFARKMKDVAPSPCRVLTEPVREWEPELADFYEHPQRPGSALLLQLRVLAARASQLRATTAVKEEKKEVPLIMERSLASGYEVFVRRTGSLSDRERETFEFVDRMTADLLASEGHRLAAVLYVESRPEVCHSRATRVRCRPAEQSISVEYLRALHEAHEDWVRRIHEECGVPVYRVRMEAPDDVHAALDTLERACAETFPASFFGDSHPCVS